MSANEWARWAILGDPYARIPITMKEVVKRVEEAIEKAVLEQEHNRADEE